MARIDLVLPDPLKDFVDAEATRAGYANAAQYVEAVLDALWRKTAKARLESELIRRIEGPPAIEISDQFWDDLKARVHRRHVAGPA